jgi:hypothetical protein
MGAAAEPKRPRKRCRAEVIVSRSARPLHPVVERIAENIAAVKSIRIVKVSPEFLRASSETQGARKEPVTKAGHPTAVGVSLIPEVEQREVIFYEITSAEKGCGSRMVDAVMRALPRGWKAVVVMDWSGGFWEVMRRRHRRLVVM